MDWKSDKSRYQEGWFNLIMDYEYQEIEKQRYAAIRGEVGTSASSNGGAVDPTVDVAKKLKDCEKWLVKLNKDQAKVNKEVDKFNVKWE